MNTLNLKTSDNDGKSEETAYGFIERVVFQNEESGYAVLRVETPPPESGTFTATGPMAGLSIGLFLELHGKWIYHQRYGEQFETDYYRITYPQSKEGVLRYLASGAIPGIGDHYAQKIVEHLGERALEIIETYPSRLYDVPGIGKKRAGQIASAIKKHSDESRIMITLLGFGLTPKKAHKIVKRYGEKAVIIVKTDPYQLAEDIAGIGFLTADEIARKVGITPNSIERLRAGAVYAVAREAENGNTVIEHNALLQTMIELLKVSAEEAQKGISSALLIAKIIAFYPEGEKKEPTVYYLPHLLSAEKIAAKRIAEMLNSPPLDFNREKWKSTLSEYEKSSGITLTLKQQEAVFAALSQHLAVITGGPGTGKTTIVKAICKIAKEEKLLFRLAAPTGRAAKRITETTGEEAQTIHRLLEYNPHTNRFTRDENLPLTVDLIVLDEASMIDMELFSSVVRALSPDSRLVVVGDANQLPSVGPGRVLADIISAPYVSITSLDTIFRQSEGSSIVSNAHRINKGESPKISDAPEGEFFFIERKDPKEAAALIIEMVSKRIPDRFGLNCVDEIQVLTPMKKGETGVENMNALLQEKLNPKSDDKAEIVRGETIFRFGDKVLQTVNDYGREVFNGDIGKVIDVNENDRILTVDFNGKIVTCEGEELEGLELAYAMTIHKSQGSEYPAVVISLMNSHYVLLQRDLLYTAVTRAKRLVTIIGQNQALHRAIDQRGSRHRLTYLTKRITDLLPS